MPQREDPFTIEYYANLFSDILSDIGTGNPEADQATAFKILAGFEKAIESWVDYHQTSINSYKALLNLYHNYEKK